MQEVKVTDDQPIEAKEPPKSRPAFPAPPISDKKNITAIRWKAPIWLLVSAGLLTGLLAGIVIMHQRAISRSIIVSVNGTTITEDQLLGQIQASVGTPVIHKMGWHHNLSTHHVGECNHSTVGIQSEQLTYYSGVTCLVAALILSNLTTHFRHICITVLSS